MKLYIWGIVGIVSIFFTFSGTVMAAAEMDCYSLNPNLRGSNGYRVCFDTSSRAGRAARDRFVGSCNLGIPLGIIGCGTGVGAGWIHDGHSPYLDTVLGESTSLEKERMKEKVTLLKKTLQLLKTNFETTR